MELSENISGNNFTLSYAEDNNSQLLNRAGLADLHLMKTPK